MSMLMRKTNRSFGTFFSALCAGFCLAFGTRCEAYTTLVVPTGSTPNLETSILAATTSQFDCYPTPPLTQYANPLFAGTFEVTCTGLNPSFNPAPTNVELLQDIVTVDSTTYLYGFADGQNYQQTQEESLVGALGNLCAYATNYNLVNTTSATFNASTCADVIGTVESCLFKESDSTPTVIPQEP